MASGQGILKWAALTLLLAGQALAQQGPDRRGPQGPIEVGVIVTTEEDVPYTVTLPGRAIAYQQTGIRPQVGGEVLEISYDPGKPVKAGDVLFRLDPETLAAALTAAEAAVAGAEAGLTQAQNTVTRYRRLEGSGVSAVERANAEVALKEAEANLKSAEASRDAARLALERTEIRSPLDGMADVAAVSVGDLVTANQSEVLTTITQLDPIYVDVSESSARMLRVRERIKAGLLVVNGGVKTQLILETGGEYQGEGRIVSPGIAVSPTTGTVPIRLQFDNPDRMILPGQFLRVKLTLGTTRAVLVPQRATSRASDGTLTAFVARDGKAQQVTLIEQGSYRNSWIVTQGINPGEQLILDGLDNLRAGSEVTTIPVTIDAEGVVREATDSKEG
ncbi:MULTISPECIES: efflux RND transporter periplasmic adaptor subunit [unclassified Paracoccus (in: a-proteobacteria)]|uniref:efflux RND transporter periplasmic adaptor subunit n=1 Tax=unclassified Paracoccus (in: a-proteobacteria) TaxID=2688777 RepID=UPI000225F24C|nr:MULTISPECIES: efflux RND transporter periplasmic adaptor subunit [unclassified Paracoccus (in: a-proteobacteria)]SMG32294.1 membrane fusion protein, multidrug efflux system [Paracoccus sp. J56]